MGDSHYQTIKRPDDLHGKSGTSRREQARIKDPTGEILAILDNVASPLANILRIILKIWEGIDGHEVALPTENIGSRVSKVTAETARITKQANPKALHLRTRKETDLNLGFLDKLKGRRSVLELLDMVIGPEVLEMTGEILAIPLTWERVRECMGWQISRGGLMHLDSIPQIAVWGIEGGVQSPPRPNIAGIMKSPNEKMIIEAPVSGLSLENVLLGRLLVFENRLMAAVKKQRVKKSGR